MKIFWKKIRVLVTNQCNYNCPFCHNEGQDKVFMPIMMSFTEYQKLIDILSGQDLEELNFSGGEPFFNKNIVEMIEYANNSLSCDISCATNLSLITEEQIGRLSKTRIKFNVQFPYVEEELFSLSTRNGHLSKIVCNIKKVREANIAIGLNSVIQTNNVKNTDSMIQFAIENELPLKLLPEIGSSHSERYKDFVFPLLEKYSVECKDKGTGAIRWVLEKNGHQTVVLYIDSPCFRKDIKTCRNYGEIRVHPDMSLQTCLLQDSLTPICFENGQESVINKFADLWKNFKTC